MKRMLMSLLLLLLAVLTPAQALASTVYESEMILVNKEYGLPKDYVPSDLTPVNVTFAQGVAESKKQMRADAAKALEILIRKDHPHAPITIVPCTALCSFYAESGGLLVGYEDI